MGFYILIGIISLVSWLVSNKLKNKFKYYSNVQLRNGLKIYLAKGRIVTVVWSFKTGQPTTWRNKKWVWYSINQTCATQTHYQLHANQRC